MNTARWITVLVAQRQILTVLLGCLAIVGLSVPAFATVETLPTQGHNVYRLAVAHTGKEVTDTLIVGSTYDNRVCGFETSGKSRWDAPVGGFVFDLTTGDLDGDGRDEILAACADGKVYAFSAEGKTLWQYDLGTPVYQVSIARLDGKKPMVLAGGVSRELTVLNSKGVKVFSKEFEGVLRLIRAGNFAGGSMDEVAVFTIGGQQPGPVKVCSGPQLTIAPAAPAGSNVGQRDGTDRTMDGLAADLDGDGRAEWVSGAGVFSLAGQQTRLFELARPSKGNYDFNYRMRMLAVGELAGVPGREIATVDGPDVMLHDARGKVLGRAHAPFGFTAIAYLPGKPFGSVVLGSCPNGDDNLYRITFTPGWEKEVEALTRQGQMATIGKSLADLSADIKEWKGTPAKGQTGPYLISLKGGWMDTPAKVADINPPVEDVRFYEQQFPYTNLVFGADIWFTESGMPLRPDGKPWEKDRRLKYQASSAQIVEAARKLEQTKAHFFVTSGHGLAPFITPDTAAAILRAAPTMCLGFIEAENEATKGGQELAYYLQSHIAPILDACLKHGRAIMVLREKNAWWAAQAASPDLSRILFSGKYHSVLVPGVEDSNSRSQDLNLASRVGLWLDGEVDRWSCRICADFFCFNRAWEWEYPMTGHPHLRNYTAHASLGASVFMLQSGERDNDSGEFTRVGIEGAAPFLNMLGKGIITPPLREQLKSISPVVINVMKPTDRFLFTTYNGHNFQRYSPADLLPNAFSRLDCYWGMAPTPAYDVSSYVYNRTHQFDNTIPRTPSGFVAILAGAAPSDKFASWSTIWNTDGDKLAKGRQPFTLETARDAMRADIRAGAEKFPMQIDGEIFSQQVAQGPDHYLLYLIDPGYLDPANRAVVIHAQAAGDWQATDRLTGISLGSIGKGLSVLVPAGTLRLIEIQPISH
ncbi:MAG: hypothetical protein WCK57_02615 [Verrucomicrobiae bacterium]